MSMFIEDQTLDVEGLNICPVCAKMYMEEKALLLHVMHVHHDSQRLAHDLQADLYRRWQQRIPRYEQ